MALYAISDLHLALSTDKPMDIFGGHWINHDEKIKKNWTDKVTEEDTVLIAGDISWSMKSEDSNSYKIIFMCIMIMPFVEQGVGLIQVVINLILKMQRYMQESK